jgi:hypothetical protein
MLFAATCLFGLANVTLGAVAAPQALLLVAPGDDLQLVCERGECAVEVPTICLQPERATPLLGTPYAVIEDPEDEPRVEPALTLVGHTADGREVTLPAAGNLGITAERGHSAVKLSVPRAVLQTFGLTSLTVRLARHVALVPEVADGDPMQTEAELALVRGPLRRVAEQVLTSRGEQVAGARVVRDVINALPRGRRASPAERGAAWRQALGIRPAETSDEISDGALGTAGKAYNVCLGIGSAVMAFGDYRDCLELMLDELINTINGAYWDALKFGS